MGKAFRRVAIALLFTAVGAGSAGAQEEPQLGVEELQSIVETTRAEMFRPGEYVEGWDRGGADPDADLRALGTDAHYFQSRSPQGTSVVIVTTRPIAGYVPSRWRSSTAMVPLSRFAEWSGRFHRAYAALRDGDAGPATADQ
jgi:hypothetical protein